jgi:5-formyltetrahydrofolate cyclo-ligase
VQKKQIRKKILRLRKIKNSKNFQPEINKILKIIKKSKIKKKIIGSYYPVNFEIDTLKLMKIFFNKGFVISLPVIKKNYSMDFYVWNLDEPLYLNKYGIPEPKKEKKITPNILLVPLVAFDKKLNRLGYGGGYYDRLLKKMENVNIIKIGVALSCQKVNKIPTNKFDKKLDYIVTERNLYK